MTRAVGIDLGTTYSAVAWITPEGMPAIIADGAGETLTPSVVSFAGPAPVVGALAKADQARGESDVAAFFKSSMGELGFARYLGGRDWTATELSGLVLGHLKAQAEAALGEPVTQAVITVPEYFTHPQREATLKAGQLAGLEVLRIIGEPTAAALAYGLRPGADTGLFVVYDLGGGTFDVSVVRLTDDALEVIAATGDHELGGRDWDDRLASELAARFSAETGDDLLAGDAGELLVAIEQLKRSLSARRSAEIRVGDGIISTKYTVTRAEFGAASADLLARTAQLTEQALADAGAQLGRRQRRAAGRRLYADAHGAGLDGAHVGPPADGRHPSRPRGSARRRRPGRAAHPGVGRNCRTSRAGRGWPGRRTVTDVVAHSLGMIAESPDRSRYLNSVLLRRNSTIPCEAVRPYQFDISGPEAELEVFLTQGETDNPVSSTYLGRYLVTGFPGGAARRRSDRHRLRL